MTSAAALGSEPVGAATGPLGVGSVTTGGIGDELPKRLPSAEKSWNALVNAGTAFAFASGGRGRRGENPRDLHGGDGWRRTKTAVLDRVRP